MNEKYNDIDGKPSSKRYWAKILIKSGLAMCWVAFFVWVIRTLFEYKINDKIEIPSDLIYIQLLSGLGALGFTIGERWNKK